MSTRLHSRRQAQSNRNLAQHRERRNFLQVPISSRYRRPRLEALEGRQMLAIDVGIYYVNGYGGAAIPNDLPGQLSPILLNLFNKGLINSYAQYVTDWNSPNPKVLAPDPGPLTPNPATDAQFVAAMIAELDTYDLDDIVVWIGHSYGGDSILDGAFGNMRTAVEIDLLATLDPVNTAGNRGGFASVNNNVRYFYNRWQTNAPFPFNFNTSGILNEQGYRSVQADFGFPDEAEQSTNRESDGSPRERSCNPLDPLAAPFCIFDNNGTPLNPLDDFFYRTDLQHANYPHDDYIESQLFTIITSLLPQPAKLVPDPNAPGSQMLQITGTASGDNILVQAVSASSYEVFLNGISQGVFAPDTRIVVNGQNGNDTIRFLGQINHFAEITGDANDDTYIADFASGHSFNAGATFNGGTGDDDVVLRNGSVNTVRHTLITSNSGEVDVDGRVLVYTGLEPIADNLNAVNRIFNFNGGAETITLGNDLTTSNNISRIQSTVGELVDFVTPTATLTINSGAGPDTITLNGPDALFNTPVITVNASTSADTINVIATRAGTTTTLNAGDGLDSINIGNTGVVGAPGLLTPIAGAVVVNGQAAGANLVVDGTGAGVTADYAITSTTVTRSVPAGFGGVTYSGLSTLLLTVGAGANIISVNSTAASVATTVNTNAGADTLNIAAAGLQAPLNLNGGNDNDTFTITGVAPAVAVINIDGGLQATADGDLINIAVGTTSNTVRHFLDTSSSGRIEFDGDAADNGGAAESSVNYVGLEPINDNANAVNRVFDFGAGNDNDVSILDDGTAGNNIQRIQAPANAELVNFTSPTSSLTVNLGAGDDILSVNAFDSAFPGGVTINLNGQTENDEIRLGAAPATSTVNIDGAGGLPDRVLLGRTGAGTAVSFAQFNQLALGTTLSAILASAVNIHDSGTLGEVYIDDSGDATNRTFTVNALGAVPVFGGPGLQVVSFLPGVINVTDDQSILQLAAGTGNDTLNVNATFNNPNGGTVSTFFGNAGDDVFNIAGGGLRGGNVFNGDAGVDIFNVNVALGQDIIATSAQINGGTTPANRRDQVIITHANARNFNFNYGAGVGEIDVTGFTTPINIDTAETVRLVGSGLDTVTANGIAGVDDTFTVNPFDTNQILVFRGGNPYDGSVRATHFAQTQLPGVAGGSTSPDLRLSFIQQNGFTINGQGGNGAGSTDDRLFAYYSSDQALISTAEQAAGENPLGFGPGVLMPTFILPQNAVDDIQLFTGGNLISAVRAGGTQLIDVNVAVVSFVQPDVGQVGSRDDNPGVILNAGHETTPTVPDPLCGLRSDQVTVNINVPFPLSANGGDPVLNPAALTQGDRINLAMAVHTINVYSDKQTPPTLTFEFIPQVGSLFDFKESGFECHDALNAANVNLIGDNNDPTVDQNDNFVVVGRDVDSFSPGGDADGANEFTLRINGSPIIPFTGVEFLRVYGDDQNPPPGTPSVGPNHIDTLDIRPYADNTSRGWGIETFFNEGNPPQADGGQQDLIIYHTAAFSGLVSENIVVQPTGPDSGEIRSTNAVDGTMISTISFVANTDIEFFDDDGSVGNGGLLNDAISDQDTLTLRGANPGTSLLSGNEQFTLNITAALGAPGTPVISVTDIPTGNILYNIREFRPRAPQPPGSGSDFLTRTTTGTLDYTTIKIEPLAGNDSVTVTASLLMPQSIDLGPGNDTLNFAVGSSRVDLQACKLEYSIVSPK